MNRTPESRTSTINYHGITVIAFDFSGVSDHDEAIRILDAATRYMDRLKPDGSHFTLTDVQNTHYDRGIAEALKKFAAHNKPYVKAAAVVTASRMQRSLLSLVALFSRRTIAVFETREEALNYLLENSRSG